MEIFRDKEKFYESILNFTASGVVVIDREFKVRFINNSVLKYLEMKREDAIGSCCRRIVPPELNCEEFCVTKKTFEDGEVHQDEATVNKPDGRDTFLVTASPLIANGEVVASIEVIKDITNRKNLEEVLRREIDDLSKWHRFTVGREIRMVELKKEIEHLKDTLKKFSEAHSG